MGVFAYPRPNILSRVSKGTTRPYLTTYELAL